ncbi:MAG TPA: tyrosine-type recombinase/integrase [Cytophagaceae bacterium]|jgi:integrase/recombinase XerC|nr:tyrosine-type recombinase/integrase [Cytophagaceae bacterium]
MIDSFLKYIQFEKRYSKHTLTSYKNDLEQFSAYLSQIYELTLAEADYPKIRSWLVFLMDDDLSAKTLNRKIASLRSYFKFLLRKGDIAKDPTLKLIAPKIKKSLPVFIESNDMPEILNENSFSDDFTGIRDRLILELLYGTGMRLSELIGIKDKDINLNKSILKVLGKGNKERIIPINQTLSDLIHLYKRMRQDFGKETEDYFIVTDRGKKLYPMFVQRKMKIYLKNTAVDKKSPHVLRHTFATHLLNNGADLNAIKDLMGHSSLAATQVYTHNSIEKLKAIFEKAHPKSGNNE